MTQDHRHKRLRKAFVLVSAFLLFYLAVAYVALPYLWFHREHQSGLEAASAVTTTPSGIPGDPLNVGLVGSATDVEAAMKRAGWYSADPITLGSSVHIAESVVLDRPYTDAPVSTLLYEGRKQDMAFEKPIGDSADRRNHVRLWKVLEKGDEGRSVWLGSATLDARVGLSHDTGQVTHHIDPNIDTERDRFIGDLTKADMVITLYSMSGVGPTLIGRNGEGDRYQTDGDISVAVLSPGAVPVTAPPVVEPDPPLIAAKNQLWKLASNLVQGAAPN